ncbi:protein of unknown function DUF1501 [Emticicia oligotrophica DSM 17448]|uniref:DUF1501 domain-containing protein n=1 Tax=Emticicia oligotrophica (strain DSM 17448 / CIP 109782 / MTCC 6937 / GPTSA100-15) TaxID=929562 RepID=A0ABN4AI59_EMTOG|nr:DUF1501 domain-containing protein [Emticicia oligotrophica]AFK01557.1 protein of unknown function DUF1501 [Emticicia oligotrophica DSM 17448]
MNRRDFLQQLGCGAMGSTTLLSTLTSLLAVNGAMAGSNSKKNNAANEDYKALVCVLLAGGVDSFNILIPSGTNSGGDNGFNEYKNVRSDIAIQTNTSLLPLNNPQCTGFRGLPCNYGSYGVHPTMTGVQSLFNSGKLAFMANIGTLVEPVMNKTEFNSGLKKIPLGIYSHSDQIMQWQTSVPQSRDALGFGGRLADLLHASNSIEDISMNISLAGKNNFQRGKNSAEYSIDSNVDSNNVGLTSFPTWWGNYGILNEIRSNSINNLVSSTYANLLQKTYGSIAKSSMDSFGIFKEALKHVPSINTTFGTNSLAQDLQAIAKVMSVRGALGAKRQIFFVTYGGWDMHDNLVGGLNSRLPVVSDALKAFYDTTVELGISQNVTTFTISDFARTITSNGLGSDHAWGGNSIVMGGAVNGGKIYGRFPKMDVSNNNTQNISFRGNFIPAVSTDELYAELALWYGVSPYDLCYVLPNLGNFYAYRTNNYPIGFMNFNGTTISNVDQPQGCLNY